MAKLTALGMSLAVDDAGGTLRTITNDVGNFSMNQGRAEIDVSGLDVSGMERLLGRADTSISLSGFYNPGANLSHAVFSTVLSQAGTVTRTVQIGYSSGTVIGEFILVDYNQSVGADGSHPWTADLHATGGTVATWS